MSIICLKDNIDRTTIAGTTIACKVTTLSNCQGMKDDFLLNFLFKNV